MIILGKSDAVKQVLNAQKIKASPDAYIVIRTGRPPQSRQDLNPYMRLLNRLKTLGRPYNDSDN